MDQDFDSITIPSAGGTPAAGPSVKVEDPTAPAAVVAPTNVQPPVAATAQPVQPQPTQPPQAAPQAQPQPLAQPGASRVIESPEDFARAWDEGRNALIEKIANEQFALSDEDMIALEQSPQVALPKLLARTLFTAISAAQKLMIDQVPLIVSNHVKATTTQRSASDAFYNKFPHLKDPRHFETVQRFANIYKASFPQMPLEQRIDEIGRLAMNHLNIQAPPQGQTQQQPGRGPQPAPRVVAQQHLPAAASAGSRGGPAQPNHDPFAGALVDWGD
jgi:hypothetical protein